jgi:hypothetical protein
VPGSHRDAKSTSFPEGLKHLTVCIIKENPTGRIRGNIRHSVRPAFEESFTLAVSPDAAAPKARGRRRKAGELRQRRNRCGKRSHQLSRSG